MNLVRLQRLRQAQERRAQAAVAVAEARVLAAQRQIAEWRERSQAEADTARDMTEVHAFANWFASGLLGERQALEDLKGLKAEGSASRQDLQQAALQLEQVATLRLKRLREARREQQRQEQRGLDDWRRSGRT